MLNVFGSQEIRFFGKIGFLNGQTSDVFSKTTQARINELALRLSVTTTRSQGAIRLFLHQSTLHSLYCYWHWHTADKHHHKHTS
ncbi:MAG TPA: hypothetical protein ENI48_06330 [Thioploca sp.]|nr:hypothetical protein [Thioploca sp.]